MPTRILIAEDESIAALHLEEKLTELGYESAGLALTGKEAIEMARARRPDLILMDINLHSGFDGVAASKEILRESSIPIVYLTALSDEKTIARAKETVPFGYLIKPVTASTLKSAIEIAMEKFRLESQLSVSNRALEHFAIIAAHDLRAPARQIYLFLNLLAKEAGSSLSPKAQEYLSFAHSGAKQMRALIDDLLEFSRLSQKPPSTSIVDLNEVVQQVLKDLKPEIDAKHAKLEISSLPEIQGSREQFTRLFQNLISNALKYSNNAPEIRITASRDKDKNIISIQDNGIGITPEEQTRVFDLFYRGGHGTEYPGTGIGLANCKRIVEIQGGSIGVESKPGVGTTFHLTLPVVDLGKIPAPRSAPRPQDRDSVSNKR